MPKTVFKPGTMLNPVPAVMVSCGDGKVSNIITIAWTGIINSDPPITYVSVRKSRFSHNIIEKTGEFVINLTTKKLAVAADYCGVRSGRDVDKFKEQKLTAAESRVVRCPSIEESPVNIECKVIEKKDYPTHDMFIAEIVSVSVDSDLMDENGRLCLDEAGLIAYNHGHYFALERRAIGRFGYSVMKPKTRKRIEAEKRNSSIKKSRRRR
ncbi:flavin reductase family protein [Mogibacterium sp. NSJ-24]|jgi:flavin reductase (DIM6/NTAB) family NADH-FMN oxidoreductase RutF|uniref:Flavin reductase family protein n=1 Tax=Lentihominibacter hominis TaxID=2763645 RepID=A0A926E7K1_9FIRM|nr:flavin reductase family protein [Lentihominibacter hominis]MBC8567249.1 flavin reductase family protein [Lentihominibacter hominis]